MANLTHTHDKPNVLTKEFDFVFVTEETLARSSAAYKPVPPAAATQSASIFEQESLRQFHEEFKRLVLASNQVYCQNEELAWDDTTLQTPIEQHEIEWLDGRLEDSGNIVWL